MNGAESLVRTLVESGVDVCFTNPGTSEMHFVAALDKVEGMRCVLGLFEGVVSGAADGYARMRGTPAATLLHLGPGLGNALANLHNAAKARSPVVNVVGDHAIHHAAYDTPLASDVEGIARPVSAWVKTSQSATAVGQDGADAIAAALTPPGQVATLILPADTAWNDGGEIGRVPAIPERQPVDPDSVDRAATILRGDGPTLLLLGATALYEEPLELAGRIAAATDCGLIAECFNARMQRGAGRVPVGRIPYPVPQALEVLKGYRDIILVGADQPIAFFAHPGMPSLLAPEGCEIHTLAAPEEDCAGALRALAEAVGAKPGSAVLQALDQPARPTGDITLEAIAAAITALIPENAVVIDESVTSGRNLPRATAGAAPHDWLQNRGGAIGFGLPLSTGAAVACPDRKVVCLESDGSGMYTVQGLWTLAREGLDVTVLVFANRAYNILKHEFANVGAGEAGPRARDMLSLDRPALDWVALATGMGVEAERAETADDLCRAFERGLASEGPYLVEVPI